MSHSTNAKTNKQQDQPKVFFKQYLYNSGEPMDNMSQDTPAELEAELLENSYVMRRRFRNVAKKLRNRYS
jgi:hypothetical protein